MGDITELLAPGKYIIMQVVCCRLYPKLKTGRCHVEIRRRYTNKG